MPTVLRVGPYQFFFYSSDRPEPPHIHVERDGRVAKFWLAPARLARTGRFPAPELKVIARHVRDHEGELLEAWREYFER